MVTSLWLPAALLAGLFQAWRTALQQRLRGELNVSGAALVRYLYGAPVAAVLTAAYLAWTGAAPPPLSTDFVVLAAVAGLAQVLATALLIMSFSERGFVVGTAFSKTEALQAAAFSFIILGERLTPLTWIGIFVGVFGVLVLALGGRPFAPREVLAAFRQRGGQYGIAAGALFALTGVLVKRATELLPTGDAVAAALVSLTSVMILQTVMHGGWLSCRDRKTLAKVLVTWRSSSQVGVLAAIGSACWFTGFATAPVALVRIVGQVEVLFTIAFAHLLLREPVRMHESAALLLIASAVVLALLGQAT